MVNTRKKKKKLPKDVHGNIDFNALIKSKAWSGDDIKGAFLYCQEEYEGDLDEQLFNTDNYMDNMVNVFRDVVDELVDIEGYYADYTEDVGIQRLWFNQQTTCVIQVYGSVFAFSYYKNRGRLESFVNVLEMRPITLGELRYLYKELEKDIAKVIN